jgi:hypothetical protein
MGCSFGGTAAKNVRNQSYEEIELLLIKMSLIRGLLHLISQSGTAKQRKGIRLMYWSMPPDLK